MKRAPPPNQTRQNGRWRPATAPSNAQAAVRHREPPTITEEERRIDLTLADSFPASDPPSWTLGVKTSGERDG